MNGRLIELGFFWISWIVLSAFCDRYFVNIQFVYEYLPVSSSVDFYCTKTEYCPYLTSLWVYYEITTPLMLFAAYRLVDGGRKNSHGVFQYSAVSIMLFIASLVMAVGYDGLNDYRELSRFETSVYHGVGGIWFLGVFLWGGMVFWSFCISVYLFKWFLNIRKA